MKRLLLLSSASIFLTLGVVSCSSTNKEFLRKDSKNVFSLQAATGMNMVSAYFRKNDSLSLRKSKNISTFNDEQITQIKEILPTIDLLLDNKSTIDSYVEVVNVLIDEINYEYKEVISFIGNDLSSSSYTLFYNDNSSDGKEKNVSGIAYISEEEYYPFYSSFEEEKEDDEEEKTRKFVITKNESSYIKIKEEFSLEENEMEQELHYEVVEDGVKVLDYKIEIEQEENENEIEIELENKKFKVKRELQEGELIYFVSLKENDNKQKIIFKKETLEDGTFIYNVVL